MNSEQTQTIKYLSLCNLITVKQVMSWNQVFFYSFTGIHLLLKKSHEFFLNAKQAAKTTSTYCILHIVPGGMNVGLHVCLTKCVWFSACLFSSDPLYHWLSDRQICVLVCNCVICTVWNVISCDPRTVSLLHCTILLHTTWSFRF